MDLRLLSDEPVSAGVNVRRPVFQALVFSVTAVLWETACVPLASRTITVALTVGLSVRRSTLAT